MAKTSTDQSELSQTLLHLSREFRRVRNGHYDFTPQTSATFQAQLDDAYEEALLLETACARIQDEPTPKYRPTGAETVVAFPRAHVRPHLVKSDTPDGSA